MPHVLACGAIADGPLPMADEKTDRYEELARMALGIASVIDNTTLEAVQALALLGYYRILSQVAINFEQAWKTIAFAAVLGMDVSMFALMS